jgi:hypothetical protein
VCNGGVQQRRRTAGKIARRANLACLFALKGPQRHGHY